MNNGYNSENGSGYSQNNRPPKKKTKFHPNKDGIMAILVLLLVVVLVITIIICCVKAISDAVKGEKNPGSTTPKATISTSSTTAGTDITTLPATTTFMTTTPPAGTWNANFVLKNTPSSEIHEGYLILVNYANEYTFPKNMEKKLISMWGQTGYNDSYVLGSGIELNSTIVSPIANMLSALKAANMDTLGNGDKILISSGYRTLAKQQELYSKAVERGEEGYSAKAGYSEHHTGLVFDLKVYTANKATVDLRANEQEWITDHCADYGFILRYDESKTEITKILGESWHFRYVGIPHAKYMTERNLCLEEYIELLRNKHTYGKAEPLYYTADGASYIIYFVPSDMENGVTSLPVPADSSSYTVSGNNVDGFIVTITK